MAIIAFAITKQTAFRDSVQEFSNVYHYEVSVPPNEAEASSRLVELETFEKSFHASAATFLRARAWTAGGSPSENEMIADNILTGAGLLTSAATYAKERAYLCQWPAGVDSRNRVVYLRKWWHTCGGSMGSALPTATMIQDNTGWTSTQRTNIAAKADEITNIGSASEYVLCGPTGRNITAPVFAHPYLEHRQFGDMWRSS